MYLFELTIETRVIIGISAMVLLFSGFILIFITSQRKKLKYHKDLQQLHEEQKQSLVEQNTMLENRVAQRTNEILVQKNALQTSLQELKATQIQLIQKEKMASLGELTAGIAHEIQNPLNFVNNYSEVNVELIEEIKEEIEKGNLPEIKAILSNLEDNETKIVHHGKRADAIVKGMLQHSRTNSGIRELTDLNALVSEYLRLSYQSLKTSDVNFDTEYQTDFDPDLHLVDVVPQDLGRVLLNIINNAFQACAERKRNSENDYRPKVIVTTKRLTNSTEIYIKDNGSGIPEEFKDKIFQPFFTTKPTGQGTGLGLSLAYDIVKAHGGELSVESKVKEGTVMKIALPSSW